MKLEKKIKKDIELVIKKILKVKKIKNLEIAKNLDSVQMIELIVKIEKKFNFKIDDRFISEQNFRNIDAICLLINKILNDKKK